MGLVLSYNKKDVSYHQAIWSLQDYEFMEFSDKFQKLNLQSILNHDSDPLKENQDLNENPNDEEGIIEKNFGLDDLIITTDNTNERVNDVYFKKPEILDLDSYIKRYLDRPIDGFFGQ